MNHRSLHLGMLALLSCSIAASAAADLARWEAGRPPRADGMALTSEWHIERVADTECARPKPAGDYFQRASYSAKVTRAVGQRAWLTVEFLDRGYGLITISPRVSQRNQWGVARVNSGRLRRAVFRFDKPGFGDGIRIEGLDYLRSLALSPAEPPLEPAPLADAPIHFRVPSQRVTTAAGDILDVEFLPSRGTIELLEVADDGGQTGEAVAGLRNQLPLVRALGFNGVESYVRWGFIERRPGVWDWSLYDAILDEIEKHGMQWFPMLLAGSGYALPDWLYNSPNNVGFQCLEHGLRHDTQSIFHEFQASYASRFIHEFGKHYGARKGLLGVRLGPSGDYGEAQYPARGPGYKFRDSHTHIGYWAGDPHAQASFREYMRSKYGDIDKLNRAWGSRFNSFDEIRTFLPESARSRRQRIDFADWYMGAMSRWCERWADWSREALPGAVIHQSSGGWGALPIGTDYSYQARSMARVKGGIRLTNEADNFADNFSITRMASSAARFYGAALGFEPGGGHGGQHGVVARLYNAITSGAEHLFFYQGNLSGNDHAIEAWLRYGPLLDERARPLIDVAVFYPDTHIKLDDEVVRYRWGSPFFAAVRDLRSELDFDYASEQMILDGALDRYKVLVFLWGSVTERPVLERIDRWVKAGGTVIAAIQPRGFPATVENDPAIAQGWMAGRTGAGRAAFWNGDAVPPETYVRYIRQQLLDTPRLRPEISAALRMKKPNGVFWSVLENGKTAWLNFTDEPAVVHPAPGTQFTIEPYGIAVRR